MCKSRLIYGCMCVRMCVYRCIPLKYETFAFILNIYDDVEGLGSFFLIMKTQLMFP